MKFNVQVIEITVSERQVIADSYEELIEKVKDQREYVGRCIEQPRTQRMYAEVTDHIGRKMDDIQII